MIFRRFRAIRISRLIQSVAPDGQAQITKTFTYTGNKLVYDTEKGLFDYIGSPFRDIITDSIEFTGVCRCRIQVITLFGKTGRYLEIILKERGTFGFLFRLLCVRIGRRAEYKWLK